MATDIEPWAITQARYIFLGGACRCTEETCDIHLAIAEEMQAQRWMGEKIGRRDREAEIVAYLRRRVEDVWHGPAESAVRQEAIEIERGAGCKEDK